MGPVMTKRETMIAVRDWGALLGAVAMVGFLTFVPQHAPVVEASIEVRHSTVTEWPSRTAEIGSVGEIVQ